MNDILPERITQARELRGLTKTELAERLGLSPAAVAQWESGTKSPTAENLANLARALDFSATAFQRPQSPELNRQGPISFRAKADGTTKRENLKAEQLSKLTAEVYLWLRGRVELPRINLPDISQSRISPEEAAVACRRAWNLGDRPIMRLGELLESNGIVVLRADFENTKLDAFSVVLSGRAFIYLGSEKGDRARSRFDACHELGHLVLHQHRSEHHLSSADDHRDLEKQVNDFASAFLMPAATFAAEVRDTTLSGFLRLKQRWGVAVQAMVVRAHCLGLIDDRRRTELFRQMSARGWRKAKGEPLDEIVPEVTGSVGRRCLDLLVENHVIRKWEVPIELPFPEGVLHVAFSAEPGEFAPPQGPQLRLLTFDDAAEA